MSWIGITLLVLVAIVVGFVVGKHYPKWKMKLDFLWLADDIRDFEHGKRQMVSFHEWNGYVSEVLKCFNDAMFPRLVELARYREDADWLLWKDEYWGGGEGIFDRIREKRSRLPSDPGSAVPKTRVAAPRTG